MNHKRTTTIVRKTVCGMITTSLFFSLAANTVHANITTRQDAGLDESLADQSQNEYRFTDKVVLVPIDVSGSITTDTSAPDWYQGLYYYLITRYGYLDMPFNFVISWDGSIFEGKNGSAEVQTPLRTEDLPKSLKGHNPVTIGVAWGHGIDITDTVREQVRSVLSQYKLSTDDVLMYQWEPEQMDEATPAHVKLLPTIPKSFKDMVDQVKKDLSTDFEETDFENRAWEAYVSDIKNPASVKAGDTFDVSVKLKNTGEFPWHSQGVNTTFISTSVPSGHNSDYFVENKWPSFSRALQIAESPILPEETRELSFPMAAPLIPGEYEEKFELLIAPEYTIPGSQFSVKFHVEAGNETFVQVTETGPGYVNLRDGIGLNSNVVSKIESGSNLIKLEEDQGWVKVKTRDGTEGWMVKRYLREL